MKYFLAGLVATLVTVSGLAIVGTAKRVADIENQLCECIDCGGTVDQFTIVGSMPQANGVMRLVVFDTATGDISLSDVQLRGQAPPPVIGPGQIPQSDGPAECTPEGCPVEIRPGSTQEA